jgi:hypothetical protein
VYARRVRGTVLEFGHRGWLLDESFIFYDTRFDSLWVQATGRCIDGRFKGEQLQTFPVTHTTWGQWTALHPTTVVLAKPSDQIERYRVDGYGPSYERWGTEFGLAVFVGDAQKLFPLKELEKTPVVQETLGGVPLLIVFHESSRTAIAWDPTVGGEVGDFELVEATERDIIVRDRSSGVLWSGLTGTALPPAESGDRWRQLLSTQFVVSKWQQHFPNGEVFRP